MKLETAHRKIDEALQAKYHGRWEYTMGGVQVGRINVRALWHNVGSFEKPKEDRDRPPKGWLISDSAWLPGLFESPGLALFAANQLSYDQLEELSDRVCAGEQRAITLDDLTVAHAAIG